MPLVQMNWRYIKTKKSTPSNEEQFNELIKKENIELSEKEQQKRKICLNKAFKQLAPKCQKTINCCFYLQ